MALTERVRDQAVDTVEHVVLVDRTGRATGTAAKATVHGTDTPLHLAFSCHLVGPDGTVLLTRRAAGKPTWPGTWTNGCCGHPQVGETLRSAATRRIREELGVEVARVALAIPDFAYRAAMPDGVVEHELCPVLVAEIVGDPVLDHDEVDDHRWLPWDAVVARAADDPGSLSPWSVAQVAQLQRSGRTPSQWLDDEHAQRAAALDRVIGDATQPGPTPSAVVDTGASAVDPLDHVARRVHAVLDPFLQAKGDELVALHPALADVADAVRSLVDAGGKRLRPAFVYWGHLAAGGTEPGVLHAAGSVELLHTFALLHDDVMDKSARRRGRPAAHVTFADLHRAELAFGDSDWFGCSAAVLAGDLVHVWADELLQSAPLGKAALDRARQVYDRLRTEVIAGQYLDLRLAATTGAQPADAELVAMLKSARYTVTRPLLLGAALADPEPTPALLASLGAYGDAVGLAFQLRDDVLGLFGDPGCTGKSDLDDLREGKRTVLVLRALELGTDAERATILASLGDPHIDDAGAAAVREAVERSGALASVERLLTSLHDTAVAHLQDVVEPARSALLALASLSIERSS